MFDYESVVAPQGIPLQAQVEELRRRAQTIARLQGGHTHCLEEVRIFRKYIEEHLLRLRRSKASLTLPPDEEGNEHQVWFLPEESRFVKVTWPDFFGLSVLYRQDEDSHASPIAYLERWQLHNELFGDNVEFVGYANPDEATFTTMNPDPVQPCIFCRIVHRQAPAHVIWEDEAHLAFLSIYPNTTGFSVVIPKAHHPSYAFDLPDKVLADLTLAARQVGLLLDRALVGVARTGLIFEGYGVDHVHAKLFPMHGTGDDSSFRPISSSVDRFFQRYEGYISSNDGARANDEDLSRLADHIRSVHS